MEPRDGSLYNLYCCILGLLENPDCKSILLYIAKYSDRTIRRQGRFARFSVYVGHYCKM